MAEVEVGDDLPDESNPFTGVAQPFAQPRVWTEPCGACGPCQQAKADAELVARMRLNGQDVVIAGNDRPCNRLGQPMPLPQIRV